MFKKEKGITLVALVVTIIILLILAGVTLSLALNGNGIFNKAKNAAKRYTDASENETQQIDEFEDVYSNVYDTYFKD